MITVEVATLDTREARKLIWENFEQAYLLNRSLMRSGFAEPVLGPAAATIGLSSNTFVSELELLLKDHRGQAQELVKYLRAMFQAQSMHAEMMLWTIAGAGVTEVVLGGGVDKHVAEDCPNHAAFVDSKVTLYFYPNESWLQPETGLFYPPPVKQRLADCLTLTNQQLSQYARSQVLHGVLDIIKGRLRNQLEFPLS